MFKISKRLTRIASMVSATEKVADIGCDHGYLSIFLSREMQVKEIIACDVVSGPLSKARENISNEGLNAVIQCRLSDGFSNLEPGEVKSAVIAGMGGSLIGKILSQSPDVVSGLEEIVISPQSEIFKARETLIKLGFFIDKEDCLFEDGKFYQIIHGTRTSNNNVDRALALGYKMDTILEYGPCLLSDKNSVLKEYLSDRKDKYQTIIDKTSEKSDLSDVYKKLEVINNAL